MTQKTSDMIDVAIRVAREFGFPCIVLAVLAYWGQLAAVALHETLLVPVVESHTTFLEATSDTLRVLGSAQERQAETLEEIAAGQLQIQKALGTFRGTGAAKP